MNIFRRAIFDLLAEGQELSNTEKYLVGRVIDKFVQDYMHATGEDPRRQYGNQTIHLITPRLEAFGFKMPTVDRWTKEDMITIRHYAEIKKGIENGR
ncbi:MAG: hypothetical protein V1810_03535 [Candidatus Beckwithbacteria bacterium]